MNIYFSAWQFGPFLLLYFYMNLGYIWKSHFVIFVHCERDLGRALNANCKLTHQTQDDIYIFSVDLHYIYLINMFHGVSSALNHIYLQILTLLRFQVNFDIHSQCSVKIKVILFFSNCIVLSFKIFKTVITLTVTLQM